MKILSLLLFILISSFAAADSVDYLGGGSLQRHDAGMTGKVAAGKSVGFFDELMVVDDETTGQVTRGDLGRVAISTGVLSKCGSDFCSSTGMLDISSTQGALLFKGALTDVVVSQSGGNIFFRADDFGGGTTLVESKSGVFSSNALVTVRSAVIAEPAALWLLGVGMVGLSFVRRSLG